MRKMYKKSIFTSIFIFSSLWFAVFVNAYTIQDFVNSFDQFFSNPQNNALLGGFDFFQWIQNLFSSSSLTSSSCCCYASGGGASCTSSCYYNCAGSPCDTQSQCYQSSSSSSTSSPSGKCGNGIVDSGEVCDTGKSGYCEGCQFRCHPYKVKEVCKADCSGYQDSGICVKDPCGSDDKCAGKRLGETCDASTGGICSACKCTVYGKSCQELCNNAAGSRCAWYSCPSGTTPQPLGDNSCSQTGTGNRCCCSGTTTSSSSSSSTSSPSGSCTQQCQSILGSTGSCRTGNICLSSETNIGQDGCSSSQLCCCSGTTTSSSSSSSSPSPGSIRGSVIDSISQKPVPNAAVAAANWYIEGSTSVTDNNGNFLINNLQPSKYSIAIVADGYIPRVVAGVLVQSGTNTDVPPIELYQPSPTGNEISISYGFQNNQVLSILIGKNIQGNVIVNDDPSGFTAQVSSSGQANLITFVWHGNNFVGVYTSPVIVK